MNKTQRLAKAFSPGDMLKEKLAELNMSAKDFAEKCGLPEKQIDAILKGQEIIEPYIAQAFEDALGIPARLWLRLELMFAEYKAWRMMAGQTKYPILAGCRGDDWAKKLEPNRIICKRFKQVSKKFQGLYVLPHPNDASACKVTIQENGIVPEGVPEFRLFNDISCRWPSPAKRKRLNKEIEKRMAKEEWKKK